MKSFGQILIWCVNRSLVQQRGTHPPCCSDLDLRVMIQSYKHIAGDKVKIQSPVHHQPESNLQRFLRPQDDIKNLYMIECAGVSIVTCFPFRSMLCSSAYFRTCVWESERHRSIPDSVISLLYDLETLHSSLIIPVGVIVQTCWE